MRTFEMNQGRGKGMVESGGRLWTSRKCYFKVRRTFTLDLGRLCLGKQDGEMKIGNERRTL